MEFKNIKMLESIATNYKNQNRSLDVNNVLIIKPNVPKKSGYDITIMANELYTNYIKLH